MWNDPSGLFIIPALNAIRNVFRPAPAPAHTPNVPPVAAWRTGDNVTISAHVLITGSGGEANRQQVVSGIINNWQGDRGGLNVRVNIIDTNFTTTIRPTNQAVLSIEVREGAGRSALWRPPTWTALNPGHIVLYTHFWEGHSRQFEAKTPEEFMLTAAHEFGHALGVSDGFGFGYDDTRYGDIISLMSSVWDSQGATRLDVEMALQAIGTNTWQEWYGNPLVQIHGISR